MRLRRRRSGNGSRRAEGHSEKRLTLWSIVVLILSAYLSKIVHATHCEEPNVQHNMESDGMAWRKAEAAGSEPWRMQYWDLAEMEHESLRDRAPLDDGI